MAGHLPKRKQLDRAPEVSIAFEELEALFMRNRVSLG